MAVIKKVKEEQLEFDFEFGCPHIEPEYYREGAQDLIRRIVPVELLQEKGIYLPSERARFADMLPLISWSDLSKAPCTFSVLLLCKYRFNACNFFYDMVSRWLLPSKRVNVELFFASDVRVPHLSEDLLSVAEIVIHLKSAQDVEEVRRNLQVIETEIRLGVVSNYHARRILEFKGLSSDGKTAMIQEKIGSLIHSHSKDFDRGIFTQMQQFLVTCQEDFKNERDYHHISRIISNLYSLRKLLKQNIDVFPSKRHIHLKFIKTQLSREKQFLSVAHRFDGDSMSGRFREDRYVDSSVAADVCGLGQKVKHVLGVLVGLNFLRDHEVFETSHLVNAIQKHYPLIHPVEGSFFIDRAPDSSLQTLYLEIEKPEGSDFSLDEIQVLRTSLPEQIKGHIEQLAHPIFMPRNEEEVLRNIMALSRQLRYVNDMPQVIITFDEQKGEDLSFTVIILRVQSTNSPTLQEVFARSSSSLKYIPDRIRRVGHLRKKYVKEATVFRTVVKSEPFLRRDCSVDMYQARQYIFLELCKLIGEVRDYNGGMIYKQNELLALLKSGLGRVAEQHNLLLEKFYYSLNPIEMRTSVEIDHLKQMFLLLLQAAKTGCAVQQKKSCDFLYKQDPKRAIAIIPVDVFKQKMLIDRIGSLALPVHQFVSFALETDGTMYSGYLLLSEDKELQARFLSALEFV